MTGIEEIARHRAIWETRPELRHVYHGWFRRILDEVGPRRPVVEIGAGPGFLKDYAPHLIASDLLPLAGIQLQFDAGTLPFRGGSVGAIVGVDVLHHLPRPLAFARDAGRVLHTGGRVVLLEPWITPASFLLYRFLHHEDCRGEVDPARPFGERGKAALEGNAAIPGLVLREIAGGATGLKLKAVETFVGLPYLTTLGFRTARRVPIGLVRTAGALELVVKPLRRVFATRALIVLEAT
jgi:SAM-dependent methyltransferase